MDNAFRADALTSAIEAEVKDIFIWMLAALFASWYSCGYSWRTVIIELRLAVIILSPWWSFVCLHLRWLILGHLGCYSLEPLILTCLIALSVRFDWCLLCWHDQFLEFSNAFWVEWRPFIANLADDALGYNMDTFAVFFFLSSKESLSAAQSRQRSWLHASMRISSGILWHLMHLWGSLGSILYWIWIDMFDKYSSSYRNIEDAQSITERSKLFLKIFINLDLRCGWM